MPLSHKKKLYINDDRGSVNKYTELISWLRCMACHDEAVFDEIPNSNCQQMSYPLLEVEVIGPDVSSKFLILKTDLYLIGFLAKGEWLQYAHNVYRISVCDVLNEFSGGYIGEWWKTIGPKSMVSALKELNSSDMNLSNVDDMKCIVAASQNFCVVLSEAARFYPVESLVCETLAQPLIKNQLFDNPTYEDEEKSILEHIEPIGDDKDILHLVKKVGNVDFNFSKAIPDYIDKLIHKHALVSKVWHVYSLSGRRIFYMDKDKASMFHMKSRKSLRCTLGVLSNSTLDKILKEWVKKLNDKNHPQHHLINPQIYAEMEEKIRELQNLKRVN